ncbi:MAG TPA: NADP-dependent oxidoreductase [Beijerinckia sp.]|nr:NADP-dependent oxidoreductase [Beijerinckia sp.]
MPQNRGFVLASRPQGAPVAENFRLIEMEMPEPGEGQVLVKHHYLSLDPYMRGRMNDVKSYTAPQKIDEIMIGGTVGEVIASKHPNFAPGDRVAGMGGWQLYAISDGGDLRKTGSAAIPIQAYLGALGMPGVTAWYGVKQIIVPKPDETIVVSAATGAVGSVVGQLVKACGAKAVGIAGGPDKCRFAVEELGFDICLDHRAENFEAAFDAALAGGIDGVFENVGGKPLQLSMRHLNNFARIAICGLVASGYDGTPTPLEDLAVVLVTRAKIQGFIVNDRLDLWPQALQELESLATAGKLKWRETIAEGLEAAPAAFFGMLKGENFGKQLVKLV